MSAAYNLRLTVDRLVVLWEDVTVVVSLAG
jgi:hypothetical protein